MRILHISADYPDPLAPAKTRAVANLLEMAGGHDHRVFSINRIDRRAPTAGLPFSDAAGDGHRAVAYGARSKGVFLTRYLKRLAEWIAQECEAEGYRPDLVHAHKLSTDGIVGDILARRFGTPLAISIQGNTDQKIVKARPDLRPLYRRIWLGADHVFPFAPWASSWLAETLGARAGEVTPLPCPTPADTLMRPEETPPVIRTACNLKDWRNKNLLRLIQATGAAAADVPDIRLEIVGGGDAEGYARLVEAAAAHAPGRVAFLGPVPHGEMQQLLNQSAAFALVSHRETYGMVFAEALLAGAPCLIPRGRAIDGYLEDGEAAISVDPTDDAGMAAGLVRLAREQADFKARLAALGARGGLDFMRRNAIRDAYLAALSRIQAATSAHTSPTG